MDLLKKVIFVLFVSTSMMAVAPAVMAEVPETASREEVAESIEEAIKLSGETQKLIKWVN